MGVGIMLYDVELDFVALILYFLIIGAYYERPHIKDKLHKIYIALFTFAVLMPVFDIFSTILLSYYHNAFLINVITGLYYVTIQGITFFFLMYIMYQLEQYQRISSIKRFLIKIPLVVMLMIIMTNGLTGWLFTYSEEIGYHIGPFQWVSYVVAFFYFFFGFFYVLRNRKAYSRKLVKSIISISVINILAIGFQILFPQHLIISLGFAVSMVLLFLTARTQNAAIDMDTGMLNREYFASITGKMIYSKMEFSVILIRIADYDMLSSIYGVKQTEKLLKLIARALLKKVEIGDGFQTSNSNFAIIVKDKSRVDDLLSYIEELFMGEWLVHNQKLAFSYFITAVDVPENANSTDELMEYITYFQKNRRQRYGIVPVEELKVRDRVRERSIEKALQRGLSNKSFEVFYQPICTADTQKFITAEALIRYTDSEMGVISPGEFIPVAEHSGLMVPIGNFVIEEVCRFISSHDMEALGLEYIEINLSVIQVLQRDFIDIINDIAEKYNIDSRYICFEITETAANCSPESFVANLLALTEAGYNLAIDDFGTGYANLQRMFTTNYSIVKFDTEMTHKTCSSVGLRKSFARMVQLFHSIGLKVVSEGVETEEQYEYLKECKVDYIQGFYFSKAIPGDDFVEYLEKCRK